MPDEEKQAVEEQEPDEEAEEERKPFQPPTYAEALTLLLYALRLMMKSLPLALDHLKETQVSLFTQQAFWDAVNDFDFKARAPTRSCLITPNFSKADFDNSYALDENDELENFLDELEDSLNEMEEAQPEVSSTP